MRNNSYLYGSGTVVDDIPQEIIDKRVEQLNKNLKELLAQDWRIRDDERVSHVATAITFWNSINKQQL